MPYVVECADNAGGWFRSFAKTQDGVTLRNVLYASRRAARREARRQQALNNNLLTYRASEAPEGTEGVIR